MSSGDVHELYSRARAILSDLESGRGSSGALQKLLYSQIKQLHNAGQSPDAMSATLGLSINDVCGWLGIDVEQQRPTDWLILLSDTSQPERPSKHSLSTRTRKAGRDLHSDSK